MRAGYGHGDRGTKSNDKVTQLQIVHLNNKAMVKHVSIQNEPWNHHKEHCCREA